MAKQTFTTGQVLTAAQLTSLQQTAMSGGAASAKTASYTLVAADAGTAISMTSTSATTITVNTGLFAAGDTVFIQNLGTGNLTITAGTATVNTAGSLILPQYDAGLLYFVSASSAVFYDYIQVGATSPLTTKGDLYTFSTSDTRLGVGANGTVLTADSAEATGLKWAAAASSSMNWTQVGSNVSLSGVASVTISGITGADKLFILIGSSSPVNAGAYKVKIKINNNTGSVYYPGGIEFIPASTYTRTSLVQQFNAGSGANNEIRWGNYSSNAASVLSGSCFIYGGNSSGKKMFQAQAGVNNGNNDNACSIVQGGWFDSSSTISSIVIDCDDGFQNWDAGTVQVFKSA